MKLAQICGKQKLENWNFYSIFFQMFKTKKQLNLEKPIGINWNGHT
jgi:hypothetical protein